MDVAVSRAARKKLIRCLETGEVAPLQAWAREIAAKQRVQRIALANRLHAAVKTGAGVYGLHFERLPPEGQQ